jgi:hypothetical protein
MWSLSLYTLSLRKHCNPVDIAAPISLPCISLFASMSSEKLLNVTELKGCFSLCPLFVRNTVVTEIHTHCLFFVNSPCGYARDIKHRKLLNVITLKAYIILIYPATDLCLCFLAFSPQIGYMPVSKRDGSENKWFSSLAPSSLLSRSPTLRCCNSVGYWLSNYVATWSHLCFI